MVNVPLWGSRRDRTTGINVLLVPSNRSTLCKAIAGICFCRRSEAGYTFQGRWMWSGGIRVSSCYRRLPPVLAPGNSEWIRPPPLFIGVYVYLFLSAPSRSRETGTWDSRRFPRYISLSFSLLLFGPRFDALSSAIRDLPAEEKSHYVNFVGRIPRGIRACDLEMSSVR